LLFKARGLWSRLPDNWPVDTVPFFDPNNNMKEGNGSNKPQKEICLQMLEYLNSQLQVSSYVILVIIVIYINMYYTV